MLRKIIIFTIYRSGIHSYNNNNKYYSINIKIYFLEKTQLTECSNYVFHINFFSHFMRLRKMMKHMSILSKKRKTFLYHGCMCDDLENLLHIKVWKFQRNQTKANLNNQTFINFICFKLVKIYIKIHNEHRKMVHVIFQCRKAF